MPGPRFGPISCRKSVNENRYRIVELRIPNMSRRSAATSRAGPGYYCGRTARLSLIPRANEAARARGDAHVGSSRGVVEEGIDLSARSNAHPVDNRWSHHPSAGNVQTPNVATTEARGATKSIVHVTVRS